MKQPEKPFGSRAYVSKAIALVARAGCVVSQRDPVVHVLRSSFVYAISELHLTLVRETPEGLNQIEEASRVDSFD
jgi:hypothetical protein